MDRLEDWQLAAIAALARGGRRVAALKLIRYYLHCGLADAVNIERQIIVEDVPAISEDLAYAIFETLNAHQQACFAVRLALKQEEAH